MEEVWKDIVGFEGRYQVSNLGRIKSLQYEGHKGEVKIMRPSTHHLGYKVVSLGKKPDRKTHLVHVLVAQAFLEKPTGKEYINHKDGNKSNNCIDNLEWVTAKENVQHAIQTGLRDPHNTPRRYGKDHYSSKPILQYDLDGNLVKKWDSQSDVSRHFGKTSVNVGNVVDKVGSSYNGYQWRSVPTSGVIKDKIEKFVPYRPTKKVMQLTENGELVQVWNSAKEAEETGLYTRSQIWAVCSGKQNTHKGYVWKYSED